ncbi:9542_t:CDS:2, partial [Dentiscutata heterogama]
MSAMEGELSVKLVRLDDIYLAVHDGDNKHFDDGTLRSGESTKTLSIQKKIGQDQRKGTGRSYQHTVGGIRLELVFNESGESGFQENA